YSAALHYMEQHPPSAKRRPNQPRALMVAPTRELAIQIEKDARVLAGHTGYKVEVVYGGTGYDSQRKAVREGVDILIGTPGRLIDYFKQKVYDLKEVQVVVLDEADRMFDLGFIKDIRFLLHRCPPPQKRLGMLFSATLSFRVKELAYEHMNNPEAIEIEPEKVTADRIEELGFMTANDEKIPLLIGLLRQWEKARTIVFVNTKRAADEVWGFLQGNGIEAAVLSGDVPQKKRMSLLKKFSEGGLDVLVATDVAARGLHIPDVTHVVNYDLPEDPEDYVHRIGRTGRAGAKGSAISFACETHAFSLPDVEAYIGHSIPMTSVPRELLAEVDPSSRIRTRRKTRGRPGQGARRGGRRGNSSRSQQQHRNRRT
ncbi:MAG TPA: DEAD/DEAH box helicase, partial [Thiolapillus brandeum]|nr:DEAD/DEAH box helicase [Thiolapillus brandeum]